MVNIGVIGLGPIWETRYAPVLRKYRDRICVRAVYDPIASRAHEVAAQWAASPVQGALALLNRKDVRAVLLLDASWHGLRTLEFTCARKKPTYIAASLGSDTSRLRQIFESGRAEGLTLMPELFRRHSPSTFRLHELMATQLGRPKHLSIEVRRPRVQNGTASIEENAELLVGLVDWCRYIVRTPLLQVETRTTTASASDAIETHTTMQYAPARSLAGATVAELRIREDETTEANATTSTVQYKVRCERGSATIASPVEISWQTTGAPIVESLTSDRADVEVLIDHFCRRAVGGLIPVPDIADVCHGLDVMRASRESLASGQPISLNGHA